MLSAAPRNLRSPVKGCCFSAKSHTINGVSVECYHSSAFIDSGAVPSEHCDDILTVESIDVTPRKRLAPLSLYYTP